VAKGGKDHTFTNVTHELYYMPPFSSHDCVRHNFEV